MTRRTHYDTLGLAPSATADEIKRAYRRLARAHHPDHHPDDPGAADAFKSVAAAYAVLSDPAARAAYDLGLRAASSKRAASSWFDDLFSRPRRDPEPARARARSPRRGRDVAYDVRLSLEDVLRGFETTLNDLLDHPRHDQWHDDDGGLRVRIPPGVKEGQRFAYKGLGEEGADGGDNGDLYLVARIDPHPLFTRVDDLNLRCDLPLTFAQAVLGADVSVQTLEGPVSLRIPPHTQPGKRLRLRGYGLPDPGSRARGDIMFKVRVQVPLAITPEQRRALEAFASLPDSKG